MENPDENALKDFFSLSRIPRMKGLKDWCRSERRACGRKRKYFSLVRFRGFGTLDVENQSTSTGFIGSDSRNLALGTKREREPGRGSLGRRRKKMSDLEMIDKLPAAWEIGAGRMQRWKYKKRCIFHRGELFPLQIVKVVLTILPCVCGRRLYSYFRLKLYITHNTPQERFFCS